MNRVKIFLFFSLIISFGCNSSIVDDPTTTINYSIPEAGHVKLTVENSYNTVIATLIDDNQSAGSHEVSFDASNLAEGIYFYTLEFRGESGSYSNTTKHMLLIK